MKGFLYLYNTGKTVKKCLRHLLDLINNTNKESDNLISRGHTNDDPTPQILTEFKINSICWGKLFFWLFCSTCPKVRENDSLMDEAMT